LGAIIVTFAILRYTPFGLTFKAVGKNAQAAFLIGLNPNRQMLLALLLAGGFAGLAGNLQVTSIYHRLIPAISSNNGYLALLCVMLANYSLWRAPLVAFFFACLNVGSIQLPMALQLDSSLSGVIQGILVLTLLGVHAWRTRSRTGHVITETSD
jgi:simple sugar transport system permease protein